MRSIALPIALCIGVVGLVSPTLAQTASYDVLIKNGWVVDGTGNPQFRADVAVNGDEIVAVGFLKGATGKKTIDATGLYVAPGFIDMHSHADSAFAGNNLDRRKASNLVTQGISTVVFGADGRNARWPVADEIAAIRGLGVALNVIPMVGHGTIRGRVMGRDFRREATAEEIEQMKALVRQGMEEGAWGLGAGTEYSPGLYSAPEELIEICKVVAEYGGFYYAHQRSQSRLPKWQTPSMVTGIPVDGIAGIKETIRIAAETGVRAVASHIKAKGKSSWGRAFMDVMLVDKAWQEGHEVYMDQYPYETFGGGPTTLIPASAYAGAESGRGGGREGQRAGREGRRGGREGQRGTREGRGAGRGRGQGRGDRNQRRREAIRRNLADPEQRKIIKKDVEFLVDLNGGGDRLIIVQDKDGSLVGKTVAQVAEARGLSVFEMIMDFALNGNPELSEGVAIRPMAMSAEDTEHYMRQIYTATCTDGGVSAVPGSGRGRPGTHPRYFGAFPRKIARYVKDKKTISLPFAIRSMSGLGAQIIGLRDRGYIREGLKADIVVFDLDRFTDRATVLDPQRYSEGIEHMLINGEFTIDAGRLTGALPGRVITRNGDDTTEGGR